MGNNIINYMYIIIAFAFAMMLSYYILPLIIQISYKKKLFDDICERKIHRLPIPRLGGVCFPLITILTVMFITGIKYIYGNGLTNPDTSNTLLELVFLICGMILLFMVGIADDLIGVNYKKKLLTQILAASLFPLSGTYIKNIGGIFNIYEITPWIGIPLTILLVIYITNAINLIDGIDGLAAGLSAISLSIIGAFFLIIDMYLLALLTFVMLGLLGPFFYYNVFGKAENQKKLFMGDTGSLTLGYLISFLIIHFCMPTTHTSVITGQYMIIIVFTTLLVPIFDVARVVFVRVRSGKSPFMPDNNHIHHKFLMINCTARKAMVYILLLSTFFIFMNWIAIKQFDAVYIITLNIIVWIGFHLWMNVRINHYNKINEEKLKFKKIVSDNTIIT